MIGFAAAMLAVGLIVSAALIADAWRHQTNWRLNQLNWEREKFTKERRG